MDADGDGAVLAGGPWHRRLRMASGCILFAYVLTHLLDHAAGNISLAAMDAVLRVQKFIWQGAIGSLLLYGSLLVHASLGVWSLYARRYVGWTRIEIAQMALGLAVPPLLANHILVTRGALLLYGIDKTYVQELATLWVAIPMLGVLQVGVLIVAWTHGCIGLNAAFRLRPWYARAAPVLLMAAVLIPCLALLGFAAGARELVRDMAMPAWVAVHLAPSQTGTSAEVATLFAMRDRFIFGYAALIAAVLLARGFRARYETRGRGIALRYPDGRVAHVPRGFTVLDASRMLGQPHASICGGRGRCSTYRIRLMPFHRGGPIPTPPPPTPSERAVLERLGIDPTFVRLACQLRPVADLTVLPLVPPSLAGDLLAGRAPRQSGEERFIVAMFVDMRGSSALIEGRLPFDAVFLLRRFVETAVGAVTAAGGTPSQFTGDGFLALFGLKCEPEQACREALAAILQVDAAMRGLAFETAAELSRPLGYSIGAQCGRAIVGQIMFREQASLTALGEVVHTASRLEAATRGLGCDAVVGAEVLRRARARWPTTLHAGFTIRGRDEPLDVHAIRIRDVVRQRLQDAAAE